MPVNRAVAATAAIVAAASAAIYVARVWLPERRKRRRRQEKDSYYAAARAGSCKALTIRCRGDAATATGSSGASGASDLLEWYVVTDVCMGGQSSAELELEPTVNVAVTGHEERCKGRSAGARATAGLRFSGHCTRDGGGGFASIRSVIRPVLLTWA